MKAKVYLRLGLTEVHANDEASEGAKAITLSAPQVSALDERRAGATLIRAKHGAERRVKAFKVFKTQEALHAWVMEDEGNRAEVIYRRGGFNPYA